MRYRHTYRSTAIFAPFGWAMTQAVRWTVFLPFTLMRYLLTRETRRTSQQTYTAATVIATTPYEWTPYWNEYTRSWEYRLTSGTATATFYEGGSGRATAYGNPRSAP
jgi:hypothetical protein